MTTAHDMAAPHAGVVTALQNGVAVVRFTRGDMCKHCGACLAVGEKEVEMRVENTLGARVGDRVEVGLQGKRVMQASLLAYAVPLALLLVGIWLGGMISEMAAMLVGVACCGGSFFILRAVEKRKRVREAFTPRMTAILPDAEPDGE